VRGGEVARWERGHEPNDDCRRREADKSRSLDAQLDERGASKTRNMNPIIIVVLQEIRPHRFKTLTVFIDKFIEPF
jgi:hypothetical protein